MRIMCAYCKKVFKEKQMILVPLVTKDRYGNTYMCENCHKAKCPK